MMTSFSIQFKTIHSYCEYVCTVAGVQLQCIIYCEVCMLWLQAEHWVMSHFASLVRHLEILKLSEEDLVIISISV